MTTGYANVFFLVLNTLFPKDYSIASDHIGIFIHIYYGCCFQRFEFRFAEIMITGIRYFRNNSR
jgi:hypothetical protein